MITILINNIFTQVVVNVCVHEPFLVHNITLFTRCSLDDDAAKNLIGCFFKWYIMQGIEGKLIKPYTKYR